MSKDAKKGFKSPYSAPGEVKNMIPITGTPGTGKTIIAKELSLLLKKEADIASKIINITDFSKKEGLFEEYDEKKLTYPVDEELLIEKILKKTVKEDKILIIDGHLSHFIPKERSLFCLVCTTRLPELKKRLIKRKYPAEKVRENIDSEIFETCLIEAIEEGHKIETIDTSGKIEETKRELKKILKRHF
jgi:broad-specificity NMP kinase